MKKAKASLTITLVVLLMLAYLAGTINVARADPPAGHKALSYIFPKDDPYAFMSCFDVPDEYGTAKIENINAMAGWADGNFAHINTEYNRSDSTHFTPTTSDDCDEAFIVGGLYEPTVGNLWIRCYSETGHNSYVRVCAKGASGDWIWYDLFTVSSTTPQWVLVGFRDISILYVAVCCYAFPNQADNSLYVDAVVIAPLSTPSIPPSYYQVTFNIRDTSGNLLLGNIYVNGVLIGRTSLTVYVSPQMPGPYQLYVTVDDTAHYVFQQYVDNIGGSTTNNPTPIYLTQPGIITAIFAPT